jgi:CAAX prenyl protease-like protein
VKATDKQAGHGWWPYLVPYLAFLAAVELSSRMSGAGAAVMLFVKPALPLLAISYFWAKGAYPELRRGGLSISGASQDILVGIALAVLWMIPFVGIAAIRPDNSSPFDPNQWGTEWAFGVLAVRMFGYAIVTPLFEEIFIRSFVMRYSEVYMRRGDFRDVPLAHYTLTSFIATIVVFTIGHVPWEWWVAVPWVALTNLWFYYRKNLWALILVHGVTNATILIVAVIGENWFTDSLGLPISLWFFV